MTVAARPKVIEVLLAEGAPADGRLSLGATRDHDRQFANLNVVRDGAEAMAFLHRRGAYRDAPRPSLVLLDLELPRRSGREVLAEIKDHPELRRIPVVAFSSAGSLDDLRTAVTLRANCYVARPEDPMQFFSFVQHIEEFWLTRVRLPAD